MGIERDEPSADSRPWWLWPNLVGLDAPVVAVVWQRFLAASAGVRVPPGVSATLVLVVWGVYLTDRWLDARKTRGPGTDRHRFAAGNRHAVAALAFLALPSAAILAGLELPRAYFEAGGVIAVALAGYMLAVHAVRAGGVAAAGAKEWAVGLLFAAGVSVPLVAELGWAVPGWVPGSAGFAGLCGMNCLLISRWEEPAAAAPPGWTAALAGGLAVASSFAAPVRVSAALLLGVGLLAGLNSAGRVLSARGRRVLADAALLTPLLAGVLW